MSETSHHRHDGSVEERASHIRSPTQRSTITPARTPAPRVPLNPMNINAILSSPTRDNQANKTPFRHAGTKRSISSLDEEEHFRYSPRPPPAFGALPQHSPFRAPVLPHLSQAWNMTPLPPMRAGPLQPLQGYPTFPSPTDARMTPVNVPSLRNVITEPADVVQREDCDQIRQRIREYLEGGEMRVTEFQRTLNINSNSYSRFMKMTGPMSGQDNQTYTAAQMFFRQRDEADSRTSSSRSSTGGNDSTFTALSATTQPSIPAVPSYPLMTPHPPKRARTSTGSTISQTSRFSPPSTTGTPPASSSTSSTVPDISHITLPGLDTDNVPVYDSCDAIRAKITAHLAIPGISQASFLRTLAAQFHAEERKFQSKQLNTFRQYSGADKGNTSAIFYAAYVFFERVRIAKGEGKSRHREDMEVIWPNGFQTKTPGPSQRGLFSGPDGAWHVDSFGRYVFADGRVGTW